MTSKPITIPGGTYSALPRHQAGPRAQLAPVGPPGPGPGPLGLAPVRLPPALTVSRWARKAVPVSYTEAVILDWLAGHYGAHRSEIVAAVCRHHGRQAAHAAYARLMADRLITSVPGQNWQAAMITPAGRSTLARARVDAWNARHDLAAWDAAWEHPANGGQRWALACHTGMRLLGLDYSDDGPPEASLLAAWDAMGPACGAYLARASLPLMLALWSIAECGPVPLAVAAEDVRQWAAWCARTGCYRQARYTAGLFRRAAGVGLVQIGADPWPPDGETFREIVGPAAGWTLEPPAPAPRPGLRIVEG